MTDNQKISELVQKIAFFMEEKHGQSITVLDLKGVSSMCDYFAICSAPSERQVKAIAEEIRDGLEKEEIFPRHVEGLRESRWILLDYGDVVVHVFILEDREHYRLENIWKDAVVVDVDTL